MLTDRVLVQIPRSEGERKSRAGILIPATAEVARRLAWAEVVAVGPPRADDQGGRSGAVQPRGPLRGRGAGRGLHRSCASGTSTRWPPSASTAAPACTCRRGLGSRHGPGRHRRATGTQPLAWPAMPVATPIAATAEQLGRGHSTTPTAWCRPSSRSTATGTGADAGVDERRRRSERTLETGRTWFWSRSRQEYWCKGETSGDRQWVREAYYDCDGDTLLFVVEQEGGAPATPASAPASTGPSARGMIRPTREEFRALARTVHGGPGLARAAGRPDHAGRRLRPGGGRRARVPPRVGGARRALGPVVVHRPATHGHDRGPQRPAESTGVAARRRSPSTAASWPPSRASSPPTVRPSLEGLPPLHGGVVGYLGYDVVREVEHLPDVPPDDIGTIPTPSSRSSASWPPTTTGASGSP